MTLGSRIVVQHIRFVSYTKQLASRCRSEASHSRFASTDRSSEREGRTQNSTNKSQNKRAVSGSIPQNGKGIQVGQFAECHTSFSQQDVNTFGTLIGDLNPVHFPDSDRKDGHPIVHGMLPSSLFSTIFGTLIPGAIYRTQSLKFSNTIMVDEKVIGRVIVRKLKQVSRNGSGVLCICDTMVIKTGEVLTTNSNSREDTDEVMAISGDAQVWLPGATIEKEEQDDPTSVNI